MLIIAAPSRGVEWMDQGLVTGVVAIMYIPWNLQSLIPTALLPIAVMVVGQEVIEKKPMEQGL